MPTSDSPGRNEAEDSFTWGYENSSVFRELPPGIEVVVHPLGNIGIKLSQLADMSKLYPEGTILWSPVGHKELLDGEHRESLVFLDGQVRLDLNLHELIIGTEEVRTTATVFKLLEFLMSHPNIVFSKQRILEEVWGEDRKDSLDINVVETFISYARRDLGPYKDLLRTHRGMGYRFTDTLPTKEEK